MFPAKSSLKLKVTVARDVHVRDNNPVHNLSQCALGETGREVWEAKEASQDLKGSALLAFVQPSIW